MEQNHEINLSEDETMEVGRWRKRPDRPVYIAVFPPKDQGIKSFYEHYLDRQQANEETDTTPH